MDIWHNNRQLNSVDSEAEYVVGEVAAGEVVDEVSVLPVTSISLVSPFVVAYKRTVDEMELFHCLF